MIEEVNSFLKKKFRIGVETSSAKAYSKGEWRNFRLRHRLEDSEGAYMVRSMEAHFLKESEFAMQNLFHEYFGHGLFVEHALEGRALRSLEMKLLHEEKAAGIKSGEELEEFRKGSETCREIRKRYDANIKLYEGFAMWMEFYLSGITNSLESFFSKMEKMPREAKSLCSEFINYSIEYGEHPLIYSAGLPKHYDVNIMDSILRKLFKEDFGSIELALLYGSRKPYSDIDVFIVSDKIKCLFLGWIDVYAVPKETFNGLIGKLDISITDPMFSGELIHGDKAYLEASQKAVLEGQITGGMIEFHKQHSEKARMLAEQYPKESKEYRTAMRYSKSYALNAKEMEHGRKQLTLSRIKQAYPAEF